MLSRQVEMTDKLCKRLESKLVQVEAELLDFKENKTLEAYFKKVKFFPSPEESRKLVALVNEFLQ